MSDWENVVVDEVEEDRNVYYWSNGDCPDPRQFFSDCRIVHSVSGRERGDTGEIYYEIDTRETFELMNAFTEVPNPALDESCYDPIDPIYTVPLSAEFEVTHNYANSSADYRLGDYSPEESDGNDSDTSLLTKGISLVASFTGQYQLSTFLSVLSYINWSSSSSVVVDAETDDIAPEHHIYWNIDHEGTDASAYPTTDEPAGVNFTIESDPAGTTYPQVDTWAQYTVAVYTYFEDECPCTTKSALPVSTTVFPTSDTFTFYNS